MTSAAATAPPSLATLPTARGDFPTWLPAMVVKELRQGLRTRGFVGAFIIFQVVMVLLMLTTVLGSSMATASARAMMTNTINGFFWTILGAQLLLATPGRALAALQMELDSRSLDLLMLTRLTAWKIVLGKWVSLMAQALLLFTAMLPYGIVRYFMGSVDLVQDAARCAFLLGGCALLTAAGLAGSGLPKIARVLVPIVVVLGFQIVPMMMMGSSRVMRGGGPMAFWSTSGGGSWLFWFDGACILVIFLVTAVRRIAPPAENHVLLVRGLALLTLLPIPLLVFVDRPPIALAQLRFASVLIALVAAVELASNRWPMLAHRRPWVKRGALASFAGRVALPGWQSGLVFAYLGAATILLATWVPRLPLRSGFEYHGWLVLLALSGLAFPAVLLSFFSSKKTPALYGLLLGVLALVAGLAAGLSETLRSPEILRFAEVIPGTGFWILLFDVGRITVGGVSAPLSGLSSPSTVRIFQFVISVAVLGVAWWQSQNYWQQVAGIDAHLRGNKK